MFKEVADFGHGGLILFMIDSLQDYLKIEGTLKKLPEYRRLMDDEKACFEGLFESMQGVRKEFVNNYLNKVVEEHKQDTDFDSET